MQLSESSCKFSDDYRHNAPFPNIYLKNSYYENILDFLSKSARIKNLISSPSLVESAYLELKPDGFLKILNDFNKYNATNLNKRIDLDFPKWMLVEIVKDHIINMDNLEGLIDNRFTKKWKNELYF